MVSNANEDLPLPLMPVITTNLFLGMEISMFLRLCSFAPYTSINSSVPATVSTMCLVLFLYPYRAYKDTPVADFAKNFNKTQFLFRMKSIEILAQYSV